MDITYEARYHQLEEQHWWFAGRRDIVFEQIQQLRLPRTADILEIGCSGGPLLLALRAAGYQHLTGIDVSDNAIAMAQARGFEQVMVMDGARLDFADNSFDVVVASDVLEHIEDEAEALREWQRVLRPGGHLIVFVPAYQFLWSRHDEVNHHFRRYTLSYLRQVLGIAGFRVERASYWNFLLFFPTALVRRLQRLAQATGLATTGAGDLKQLAGPANSALFGLLKAENRWLRRLNFPLGVSTFAVARKPA
ncbi:class I SAM-dependent DNA methyltransferase [Hymenobacter guriensis]|uniref:Methyltransferase domain-containing protein n=1 Tax=Hymenobacter guriensis TaxID=2793065 RepID=A0ABS0L4W0_9BACT|nr:class I SAM-dependent methyltransferase [Hymenobacter guriensis]MBG8554417.1 methyltransferase domain-containing protein [Hymenobacter guriensis]